MIGQNRPRSMTTWKENVYFYMGEYLESDKEKKCVMDNHRKYEQRGFLW